MSEVGKVASASAAQGYDSPIEFPEIQAHSQPQCKASANSEHALLGAIECMFCPDTVSSSCEKE